VGNAHHRNIKLSSQIDNWLKASPRFAVLVAVARYRGHHRIEDE
jgi:hypothetical protein